MKPVLIPIPSQDFDPSEAAIPWKLLIQNEIQITFATPNGIPGTGDHRMLTGKDLGVWAPLLKADANALKAYTEMTASNEFLNPLPWEDVQCNNFSGIILPGGHAPGMKKYLESKTLQKLVYDFFAANKIVGAICHGVVLAARSKTNDNKSVLWGRKTTALLQSQELTAWAMTGLWLKNYYRTYPETVQSEVTRNLANPCHFIKGPRP